MFLSIIIKYFVMRSREVNEFEIEILKTYYRQLYCILISNK